MLVDAISLGRLEFERERTRRHLERARAPNRGASEYLRELELSIREARKQARTGRAFRREQAARRRQD